MGDRDDAARALLSGGRAEPLSRAAPAILFAHRGASARAPENTLEAFRLAIELGATGLESDVHLDADGVPVLVHDPAIETLAGRVVIRDTRATDLARYGIPTLDDLYSACGTDRPLSLDLNDDRALDAARAIISITRRHGGEAVARLFLCHDDEGLLQALVADGSGAVPVLSTDRVALERHAAGLSAALERLRRSGIGVLNLHLGDWTRLGASEAIARVHDAGLRAFAWDTQRVAEARFMLAAGADGVYADDPAVLVAAANAS